MVEEIDRDEMAEVGPLIAIILKYARTMPSGLFDQQAPEKLLAEWEELQEAEKAAWHEIGADADTSLDQEAILLEAADVTYYALKSIYLAATIAGVPINRLFQLCIAKLCLRARPGNPKDNVLERAAIRDVCPEFFE